jgi:hypothetical protein
MSGHGSAARRFVLICGYLCKSVSPKSLSNNRNLEIFTGKQLEKPILNPLPEALGRLSGSDIVT